MFTLCAHFTFVVIKEPENVELSLSLSHTHTHTHTHRQMSATENAIQVYKTVLQITYMCQSKQLNCLPLTKT